MKKKLVNIDQLCPRIVESKNTNDITCPWCGCEYESVILPSIGRNDSGSNTCSECGKKFEWTRKFKVTYDSNRVVDK